MSRLCAGAASVDITPPVGVDLFGYGSRPGPSIGIHDNLFARALYLENGGRAMILTGDLLGLDYKTNDEIRQGIADATDLEFTEIMVGCSHTHCGPVTPCGAGGEVDPGALAKIREGFISAGKLAFSNAEDAWAGHAREAFDIGTNRRQMQGVEPHDGTERGLHIKHTDVLVVNSANGPIARLFVYPAHGVTVGAADSLYVSADWMGYAQRFVEQYQPGAVPMFGQGCCGNINPKSLGSYEISEAHGRALADVVSKATEHAELTADPIIATACEKFTIPCADPPTIEQAQADLAEARKHLAQAKADNGYASVNIWTVWTKWAEWQLQMSEQNATGFAINYEAMAIRIGDFAIVGLPGELFVEYAINIEAASPFQQTAVMAYTNGNPGYIPTAAAHEFGGYEVAEAYRHYNGGYMPLKPEAERVILDGAGRVLSSIAAAGN